jgi:hypothetical protein
MKDQQDEVRLAAIKQFAVGCRSIAKLMVTQATPRDQFAALADGLTELSRQLTDIDAGTDRSLINEVAHHSRRIASALTALPNAEPHSRGEMAADLASALNGLSEAVVDIASGLPESPVEPTDGSEEATWADALRDKMGQVGFELFKSAVVIRDDFGLSPLRESLRFAFPNTSEECCSSMAVTEPHLLADTLSLEESSGELTTLPRAGKLDSPRFEVHTAALSLAATSLSEMLEGCADDFEQFHKGLQTGWGWPCEDSCTCGGKTSLLRVRVDTASATAAGGGALQPQITIKWSYCCSTSCLAIYTRCVIKKSVTGPHNVGNPVNGKAAALKIANGVTTVTQLLKYPRPAKPC